jgi:hypothetical protein
MSWRELAASYKVLNGEVVGIGWFGAFGIVFVEWWMGVMFVMCCGAAM